MELQDMRIPKSSLTAMASNESTLSPFDDSGVDHSKFQKVEVSPRYHPVWQMVRSISKLSTDGNPSRDNMSNERTLLAYIRTCLSIFLLGVLIIQFTKHTILKPVNVTLGPHLDYLDSLDPTVAFIKATVDLMRRYMNPLGGLVMSFGVCVAIVGALRYCKMLALINNGDDLFEETWILMLIIALILLSVVVTSFILVYQI